MRLRDGPQRLKGRRSGLIELGPGRRFPLENTMDEPDLSPVTRAPGTPKTVFNTPAPAFDPEPEPTAEKSEDAPPAKR